MKNVKHKLTSCKMCIKKILLLTPLFFVALSCKKLIEIDSPLEIVDKQDVYKNTQNASAVLIGIYHDLSNATFNLTFATGPKSFSVNLGLYADELVYNNGNNDFFINNLTEDGDYDWSELYTAIFRTNSAIEGISGSSSLLPEVKQRLVGEAKFLRAFFYFYLVNLYGDVPLLTTTDYKINGVAPRTSTAEVFEQIIKDLKEAQELLGDNYVGSDILSSSIERVRPNRSAATALLARVYLYNNQWAEAENEATKVIDNTAKYGLSTIDSVFLKNSKEAIWQLQPIDITINTLDAKYFVPAVEATQLNTYLTQQLIDEFDSPDIRKEKWMQPFNSSNLYFPYKYKLIVNNGQFEEYLMVLRLGEQYLIRAEARTHLDDLTGAKEDLLAIRSRAGLTDDITASSSDQLLDFIANERFRELFTEWGHRWLDLKRTGKADEVMNVVKSSTWESIKQLFPIPRTELLKNPSLSGHQNPGY